LSFTDNQKLNAGGLSANNVTLTTKSGGDLNLTGNVTATALTGTIDFEVAGTITQTGGNLTADTLRGNSNNGVTLDGANNVIAHLGPFINNGPGSIALTDNASLTVGGAVQSSTADLTLTITGAGHNLVLDNNITAGGTVALNVAGAITQNAGSIITAASLTGSSTGGTALDQANQIAALGGFTNGGGGGFSLADARSLDVTSG